MAFTRAKVSGWAYGEIFTSAQANQLDIDHANAIDGAAGGTYNLSAPIIINGDDVTIDENFNVNGTADLAGDVTLGTNALSLAEVLGDLTVAGSTNLNNDALFVGVGVVEANDPVTIDNTLTVTGASALKALTFRFATAVAADADTAYTPADAGKVYFIDTMTAGRAYTFPGSSWTDGDWFLFKHRASGGFTATILGAAVVIQQGLLLIYDDNASTFRAFAMSENFA